MLIKITPDKEKARSIIKLIENREEFLKTIDNTKYSTIATENYYEIAKELATALLILEGEKVIGENSHKETIDNLKNHNFLEGEIILLNDLRIKRNKSQYEGKPIDISYLENHKDKIQNIIEKLKKTVRKGI